MKRTEAGSQRTGQHSIQRLGNNFRKKNIFCSFFLQFLRNEEDNGCQKGAGITGCVCACGTVSPRPPNHAASDTPCSAADFFPLKPIGGLCRTFKSSGPGEDLETGFQKSTVETNTFPFSCPSPGSHASKIKCTPTSRDVSPRKHSNRPTWPESKLGFLFRPHPRAFVQRFFFKKNPSLEGPPRGGVKFE